MRKRSLKRVSSSVYDDDDVQPSLKRYKKTKKTTTTTFTLQDLPCDMIESIARCMTWFVFVFCLTMMMIYTLR
jgi:hypothetical protein